jgi:curved DNA-binding protein CbpA
MQEYKVLGVTENDDIEVIRKSYLMLVKRYHPDKQGGDPVKFREVQNAWEKVKDKKAIIVDKRLDITHASLFTFIKLK